MMEGGGGEREWDNGKGLGIHEATWSDLGIFSEEEGFLFTANREQRSALV